MATKGDIEDGNRSLSESFVDRKREAKEQCSSDNGGSVLVYLSTFSASFGSFQFGYCYSTFGSILPVSAIIGALTCGHTADATGTN
ncbi:hypothetical protein QYF36_022663 [Acer negundo]|nr:hypothetical protein QYF36_022663 [Acer negundo]